MLPDPSPAQTSGPLCHPTVLSPGMEALGMGAGRVGCPRLHNSSPGTFSISNTRGPTPFHAAGPSPGTGLGTG